MQRELQHLVGRCLGELRAWRLGPAGSRHPSEFYARVEHLLRSARRARSVAEVRDTVGELQLLVRDRGPLSEGFLPSLESLYLRVREAELERPPPAEEAPVPRRRGANGRG